MSSPRIVRWLKGVVMPWSDKAVAAEQAKQAAKEQAAKDRAARVAAAAEARQAERDLAAWQAARRGRH